MIKKYIAIIYIILSSLLSFSSVFSQNSTEEESVYYIQWVRNITNQEIKDSENITDKILNFVLGKSTIRLIRPFDVALNNEGDIFILDQGNYTVFHFNEKEEWIETYEDPHFFSLTGITQIGKNVAFIDSKDNGYYILADDEVTKPELRVELSRPTDIAWHPITETFWIVEAGNHRIVNIDSDGNQIKEIGKRGPAQLEFNYPTHIWIDRTGKIYVVDALNYRIQIISENGILINSFGQQGDATGYFGMPKGIAVDSKGHIYVVDALFHNVQIFNISGKLLDSFGKQGQSDGEFWMPNGIFIDQKDQIYIADCYNSRIQVFELLEGPRK